MVIAGLIDKFIRIRQYSDKVRSTKSKPVRYKTCVNEKMHSHGLDQCINPCNELMLCVGNTCHGTLCERLVKIKLLYLVLILFAPCAYAVDDDFWLALDDDDQDYDTQTGRSSLQLSVGGDAADGRYYQLQSSLAVKRLQVYLSASQQNYVEQTRYFGLGIGTDTQQDISARIEYKNSAREDRMETRDVLLEAFASKANWNFTLGYQPGEVEILLAQFPSFIIERFAWHYGLGYSGKMMYAQVDHWAYDYVRQNRLRTNSTLLNFILARPVLSEAQTLAHKQTGATFGLQGDKYGAEIQITQIESAVDGAVTEYLTLTASKFISRKISASLQWDKPLDDSIASVGVAVNWRW